MSKKYFNRPVVIVPYDDQWPKIFETEKSKILSALGDKNVVIKHIGSTAIPGLAAKPIIDIMIGITDLKTADDGIKPLEKIGYEYVPEFEKDLPERRFLYKNSPLPHQNFHCHIVRKDGAFWRQHLFFRDYLRKNPKVAAEYQQLKEKLAKQFLDASHYCKAKSSFIQKILAKNLK